jgi:hypothetical protein
MKEKWNRKDDKKKQEKPDYYPHRGNRGGGKRKHQQRRIAASNDFAQWKLLKSFSKRQIFTSVLFVIISIGWKFRPFDSNSKIIIHEGEKKIDKFLSWLVENGSNISKHVTLAEFQDYGGYGLLAVQESGSCNVFEKEMCGDGTEQVPALRHLDDLFTIPRNLIISAQTVLVTFS